MGKTNIKRTQHFVDTYTRIAINSNSALMDIITKHSQPSREQPQDDNEQNQPPQLLLSSQLDEALNGPLGDLIKTKLSGYATLLRVKLTLIINSDDTFKLARNNNPLSNSMSAKQSKKMDNSKLKEIHRSLDELCQQHYQQLQDFFVDACQQALRGLRETDIDLSILEIAEFSEQVPLSGLINRFTELGLELPTLNKKAFNFTKYLKLRTKLAIHSALSRQHLANTDNEIKTYIHKLKAIFSQLDKNEQALLATQRTQTDELLAPLHKLSETKRLKAF